MWDPSFMLKSWGVVGGWVAYRILVSAPVPFWIYLGRNWVGLGWDWVWGDWGLRGWGLGLDSKSWCKMKDHYKCKINRTGNQTELTITIVGFAAFCYPSLCDIISKMYRCTLHLTRGHWVSENIIIDKKKFPVLAFAVSIWIKHQTRGLILTTRSTAT